MNNINLPVQNRVDWVDYAKGLCIIAVVSFYTTGYVEDAMSTQGWMRHFLTFAQPFRMPDFFLISGLFVSRVINRPLRSYIDSKILHFIYFYALWITIRFFIQEGRLLFGPQRGQALLDYFSLYLQPHGQLWFIYMLPLFFIVVRVLRKQHPALILVAAIALKLLELNTGWKMIDRFGEYFVFFYSGHVFAPNAMRLADWTRNQRGPALLFLTVWFAVNLWLVLAGWSHAPGMQLLLGYSGAVAVLMVATLLADLPWTGWLRYLGEHSIVVYLAFVAPLAVLRKLMIMNPLTLDVGSLALLMAIISILGAIMLFWLVRHTPLNFLFARPNLAKLTVR